MLQSIILCLHKICNEMKQWIINKRITITSINKLFRPKSEKLISPRYLSTSPRYLSVSPRYISASPRYLSASPRYLSFSNPSFATPASQALHLRHLVSRPWWIINKTITVTSMNISLRPNSGKLGSPRSLSASSRSRVSFTRVTDQLYSLPSKNCAWCA